MLKETIKKIPFIGSLAMAVYIKFFVRPGFTGSASYWEKRYQRGGNSGIGSYDHLAQFKADVINTFVLDKNIQTVIEFGCGDGHQLRYFTFPSYIGFDVSRTAIASCRNQYQADPSKRFELLSSYANEKADLVLSLDVIYHLVEDEVFQTYMQRLFSSSHQYVIIYSNNTNDNAYALKAPHVKNRRFTDWIEENQTEFCLLKHIPNKFSAHAAQQGACFTDFYIYKKENQKL